MKKKQKSKLKASIKKTRGRKATISNFNWSDKKELPVLILAIKKLAPKVEDINIAIISADTYYSTCCLKGAQVFSIGIKNLLYQAEKEARAETDRKCIVSQENNNFLDVFSKKNSDILLPHQKYDHKIYLEEKQKLGHVLP